MVCIHGGSVCIHGDIVCRYSRRCRQTGDNVQPNRGCLDLKEDTWDPIPSPPHFGPKESIFEEMRKLLPLNGYVGGTEPPILSHMTK